MNYIVNLLHDGGKSVCLCRVLFCKACSFTVFCQKKCNKKKEKKRKKVTPGWNDISGPGSVSFFIQKFHVLHYADST